MRNTRARAVRGKLEEEAVEETQFINESNALVTSSRIVLVGKTFATRNVGSVGMYEVKPGRVFPILLILVGVLVCLGGAIPFGAVMVGIGGIWLYLAKSTFQVKLMAGGGEVLALQSKDRPYIQRVHDAIASAISVR
jgi:hypothetical protein